MSDEKAPDDTAPNGGEEPTDPRAAAEPSVPPPADPLEQAQAEAAKIKDQLLRLAADFDNFKKRSRRELEEATKRARDDALRDLLPVFDNLERATVHASTTTDAKALADGIGMVMRQFVDTLAKMGIQRIAAVGEAFDPAVHEAVQHLETTEHPAGSVAIELQAGYRTAERVLRPAMVVVAKAPPN
jgi:molecular chaperone GrpE